MNTLLSRLDLSAAEFAQAVARVAPNILYVYDIKQRCNVWGNDAMERLLGYSREQIMAMGETVLARLMHPDDFAHYGSHAAHLAALEDGEVAEYEYRLQRSDGAIVWLSSREMVFTRDTDGSVRTIVGSATDISETRRATDALRESEERFRIMSDRLPLIVWVHDVTGELVFVNSTYCEFFGVTHEQMRGGAWRALTHPEDEAPYAAEFARCVAARIPFEAEVRAKNVRGEWRWLASWGRPRFSSTGEFIGFVGASADITERKSAEAALREARERADLANQAKDRFLAALSHELRAPLTPVLLVAGSMKEAPELAPETREDFAMIERNIRFQARIVDDLLDLSRAVHGKMHFHLEDCDLSACLSNAVDFVSEDAAEKKQSVTLKVAFASARLHGDYTRLSQVFCNLLRNAIKFSPIGGTIEMEALLEDSQVHVIVRDSGIGLAAENVTRIFEPFEQVSNGDSAARKGLGLGLAICKSIIEAHHGRLWAESDGLGKGARFHVLLPLKE